MKNVSKRGKKVIYVDVLDVDKLALMSDDDLDNLDKRLSIERDKLVAVNGDTRRHEEELCYVQRERDLRAVRKAKHAVWLAEYRQQFEFTDYFELN